MEILFNALYILGGAGTIGAAMTALRLSYRNAVGNSFTKQLKKTVFAPVAQMNEQVLMLSPVPQKLSLQPAVETQKDDHVITATEYVRISELSDGLRIKASKLAEKLDEVQGFAGLTVEQEHDLNVVKDSLLVLLKAYDGFTPKQKESSEIQENIVEQLDMMDQAITKCNDDYEENQLRTLNANRLFLKNKFMAENQTTKVISSTVTA